MAFWSKLSLRKSPADAAVIVVSGLPRSGTSMMMKMLQAGGAVLLTDNLRAADEDNPKGYYEFEPVKRLRKPDADKSWVAGARGKAVKIISVLLEHLPPDNRYKVIFMERDLGEILASQAKMMERSGKADATGDDAMRALYERHLREIKDYLAGAGHCDTLYVPYRDALSNPRDYAGRINAFLGGGLDIEAMAAVADPQLYRNRK